jgi:3D (Asp-Asp-Asp) domain-containing protein
MTRTALAAVTALATVLGCNGIIVGPEEGPGSSRKSVTGDATLDHVQLTHYTLVTESETSGQNSGDSSILCNQNGLSGCYHKEFLCSGWGVAMQGTGVAADGKYIKYASGGGGWNSHYTWLNNCASAHFTVTDASYGSTGRALIEDYSIAVDPAVIPYGWSAYIEALGHWYRADDTGGAIIGKHIDIYEGANRSYSQVASSRVYITPTHHARGDASPFGQADGPAPAGGGSSCGAITFEGECQGQTLRWCENDVLRTADCAAQGLTCAYQDATVGYNCVAGYGDAPAPAPAPTCGDGWCDTGEDCSSCPSDCGACPSGGGGPTCGDGWCDAGEDCSSCPSDCGACSGGGGPTCGDGWCDAGEDCSSCPADCGACSSGGGGPTCGDGWCDAGEDCSSCPADCGTCSSGGGGGTCSVEGHLGLGENGDPCSEPPETWRCVYSDSWGTLVSQVCRNGEWLSYNLDPSNCDACCGSYSSACSQ